MIDAFMHSPPYYIATIVLVVVVTLASVRTQSRWAQVALVVGAAVVTTLIYFTPIPGNTAGIEPAGIGQVAAHALGGLLPFVLIVIVGSNHQIRSRPNLHVGTCLTVGGLSLLVLPFLHIYLVCWFTGTCL